MEWIDIKDKLPETDTHVLVIDKADDMYVAYLSVVKTNNYWTINCRCREGSDPYCVTHWMPIPDQPERSKREDPVLCRMCKAPYDNEVEGCVCKECRIKYVRPMMQGCGALNTMETS